MLPPQLVSTLSPVFHELATNARKHGALSAAEGQVLVEWAIAPATRPWPASPLDREGGPPLDMESEPNPRFGTVLIERSLKSIAGGRHTCAKNRTALSGRLP